MGVDTTAYRILGPLEVERDGRLLSLGGPKQRAVLAALLLHANRVVSRDRLIEIVWGESPPETAAAALQGYVAGLRKTLGAEHILTRSGGYVLEADPTAVDLARFEALVRLGADELSAGNPGAALSWLTEALDLWRGEPLGDLDLGSAVEAERLRLDELHLAAIESRIEADLELGRHLELIPELRALVREHPTRERFTGQLMLALYRSARQAEALDVYRQYRRTMFEKLGLEPGEELRRLERAILEQDPTLGPLVPPAPPKAHQPFRRRRLVVRIGATLVAAGAAAAIALTLTGGSSGSGVQPNSVGVIDPRTNKLVDDVSVGGRPVAVAVGAGGVWVADAEGTVSRIDPTTRKVTDTLGIGGDVHDLAVGFDSVWVAGGVDGTVTRIDPVSGQRTTVRVGPQPVFYIAAGAGGVWATSGEVLLRIDPTTEKVVARVPILTEPTGLTVGDGAVWFTNQDEYLWRVTRGGRLTPSPNPFPGGVLAPAVDSGSVWMIVYLGRGLIQPVDPVTLAPGPETETSAYPLDIAVGRHAVWAVDVHGTVLRVDPASTNVVARIETAPTLRSAIAVGEGAVWVAIQEPT